MVVKLGNAISKSILCGITGFCYASIFGLNRRNILITIFVSSAIGFFRVISS